METRRVSKNVCTKENQFMNCSTLNQVLPIVFSRFYLGRRSHANSIGGNSKPFDQIRTERDDRISFSNSVERLKKRGLETDFTQLISRKCDQLSSVVHFLFCHKTMTHVKFAGNYRVYLVFYTKCFNSFDFLVQTCVHSLTFFIGNLSSLGEGITARDK